MSKTTFSGPVQVGTSRTGSANNLGDVVLSQELCFTIPANITTVVDADGQSASIYNGADAVPFAAFGVAATNNFYLPANADIIDIIIDVPTAIVGPTAANLTMGISAAGTEYVSSTNLMTGPVVRVRPTFTNAQLLAMMSVSTNTGFYAQLTGTVANFTAGVVYITVLYTQV
jgi:hypothetical protein